MNNKLQRATSAIALFLVFTLSQVYVRANLVAQPALPERAHVAMGAAGKLIVGGNQPILVNGTNFESGGSVFSGSQILTPKGVPASVLLGSVTRLEVSPDTNLTLAFDSESVKVNLASGRVLLTSDKGTTGYVSTADGRMVRTGSSGISTIRVSTEDSSAPAGDPPTGSNSFWGLGRRGSIALVVSSITAAILIPVLIHRHNKHNRCRNAAISENASETEPDNDEDCNGIEGFSGA